MINKADKAVPKVRGRGVRLFFASVHSDIDTTENWKSGGLLVGATGFEPATSRCKTWHATDCATPRRDELSRILIPTDSWSLSELDQFQQKTQPL